MPVIIGRRELIAALGGAAAWPLAANAEGEHVRRVGVLMSYPESDPAGQLRASAFRQELERRGWTVGRNLRIQYQWGIGDADWMRSAVEQLLRETPDVILANGDPAARAVQRATRAVPVIFIAGSDPVANGYVQSLAHPGGNLTGFTVLEPSLGSKLLELLKEVAPAVTRVAVMFNPDNPGNRQLSDAAAAAISALAVIASPVREAGDIEAAMTELAREPNSGLVVLPDPATNSRRKLIIQLAAHYEVPAIHALRAAAVDGALISYGVDLPYLFQQAAFYADRIFRGDKPADLPVQQPSKFEMVINLRTAKALRLKISDKLLALADDLIE